MENERVFRRVVALPTFLCGNRHVQTLLFCRVLRCLKESLPLNFFLLSTLGSGSSSVLHCCPNKTNYPSTVLRWLFFYYHEHRHCRLFCLGCKNTAAQTPMHQTQSSPTNALCPTIQVTFAEILELKSVKQCICDIFMRFAS